MRSGTERRVVCAFLRKADGSEEGLAARRAPALDRALAVGRIVVGELFTLADVAGGDDPDGVADDPRVAVRLALVVDEPGDIAADPGVADVEPIELEAPDVPLLQVALLALQALAVVDLLARVVDDPGVFGDGPGGKDPPALDGRAPLFDHWQRIYHASNLGPGAFRLSGHDDTPPPPAFGSLPSASRLLPCRGQRPGAGLPV